MPTVARRGSPGTNSARSHGTRYVDGYKLPCEFWELMPVLMQEQHILLTSNISSSHIQDLNNVFKYRRLNVMMPYEIIMLPTRAINYLTKSMVSYIENLPWNFWLREFEWVKKQCNIVIFILALR